MAASATPTSVSPLTARLGYLLDLQKADDAYAEAWRNQQRPKRRVFGRQTPLRGSFSSEEAPSLDGSSELPSPSSSFPSTPAEYVQDYFERTQRNREMYDLAWSTAVEKRILCARNSHDSATKLNLRARNSNQLAAQLDAFVRRDETRDSYYEAWSNPSIGRTIMVHEPREAAIKFVSGLTNSNLLAVQLKSSAEQQEQEDAYNDAWISAAKDGALLTRNSRKSATTIASQTFHPSTLAAQLQAASDEEAAEQAYADAWSRYDEITQYAAALDAWKSHHLELLRKETEYYNIWSDSAKTAPLAKPRKIKPQKSEVNPFASQLAMFQDIHARNEQYNEAWIAYGQRHTAMAPAPVRTPRRRSRLSISRSPRPAFTRRLLSEVASPEIPMLGFSAIDVLPENDEYIKSWADKMKTTTITPANSLLFSPPTKKRVIPSSPRPKKRADKSHFMWPEDISEEEMIGLTARGNLQPYLSSLLGKIVSFELVGQTEPTIHPDQASPETPMQLVRRANLNCQSQTVCKVKASISITSPPTARRYAQDPLPIFDALREFGHASIVQLDQVGILPPNPATGRQAIWRKYSVVSGAFRCEVKETFVDRRVFSKDGCEFGKKVVIKDGLIMSPDGADYLSLPL